MMASIAYAPTKACLNARAFLENLGVYKMRHPVIFYSDGDVDGAERIANAEVLKGHRNRTAVNNYLFLCGLKLAVDKGVDRFIFLETDVRVGCDDWDGIIFREAEAAAPGGFFCAGTPCIWNASEMPPEYRQMVNTHVRGYQQATQFLPPSFHSRTKDFQTRQGNSCLFIMGAGAVYDTKAMMRIFEKALANPMQFACQMQAFDLYIGLWCARVFGSGAIQKLPWLKCIWSGYKDKVFDQTKREELLRSGRVVLVHQIKNNDSLAPNRNFIR